MHSIVHQNILLIQAALTLRQQFSLINVKEKDEIMTFQIQEIRILKKTGQSMKNRAKPNDF